MISAEDELKKIRDLIERRTDPTTRDGLDTISRLNNDGSQFWEDLRQELIEAGKRRDIDGLFFAHNQLGQKFEKAGALPNAIKAYRANTEDNRLNTRSTYPHHRLMIIYRRQKDFIMEIQTIQHLLGLSANMPSLDITTYQKRLSTALALIARHP